MGLRPEDYGRLTCVIADCPTCGAKRGQVCRNEKTGRPYALGNLMHVQRKNKAYTWRVQHGAEYQRLRQQIVRELHAQRP